MTYLQVTVVMAYKNLKTFKNEFAAFTLEDTDNLVATRNFVCSLKSNNHYEILGMEYELEKIDFTDPSSPIICNTIH
jgi:hypothetical protein